MGQNARSGSAVARIMNPDLTKPLRNKDFMKGNSFLDSDCK